MSEAEVEILTVPEKEQLRLSLVYIVKMLGAIDQHLEALCEILVEMSEKKG